MNILTNSLLLYTVRVIHTLYFGSIVYDSVFEGIYRSRKTDIQVVISLLTDLIAKVKVTERFNVISQIISSLQNFVPESTFVEKALEVDCKGTCIERKETIERLFSEKFNRFLDEPRPNEIILKECPTRGATFSRTIASCYDSDLFVEGTVQRAIQVYNMSTNIPTTLIEMVMDYILYGDNDSYSEYEKECVSEIPLSSQDLCLIIIKHKRLYDIEYIANSAANHIRFLMEMTIEYNQINRREELLRDFERGRSLDEIVEDLKAYFHNTWRKTYIDYFWPLNRGIDREYARLNISTPPEDL